jgi:hypothetical protein
MAVLMMMLLMATTICPTLTKAIEVSLHVQV